MRFINANNVEKKEPKNKKKSFLLKTYTQAKTKNNVIKFKKRVKDNLLKSTHTKPE